MTTEFVLKRTVGRFPWEFKGISILGDGRHHWQASQTPCFSTTSLLGTGYIIQWWVTQKQRPPPEMACIYCILYCLKNPVIPLLQLLWHLKSQNQNFFCLLIGQTVYSVPPKIIFLPICMTELFAVFVCNKCKFMNTFDWLWFPQIHPCRGRFSESKINLNTSKDSCLQFGTLFEKIEALDHLNKME